MATNYRCFSAVPPSHLGQGRPHIIVPRKRRDPGAQQQHNGRPPQEDNRQAEQYQLPHPDLAPLLVRQDRAEEDEVCNDDDKLDAALGVVLLRLVLRLAHGVCNAGDRRGKNAIRACGCSEVKV